MIKKIAIWAFFSIALAFTACDNFTLIPPNQVQSNNQQYNHLADSFYYLGRSFSEDSSNQEMALQLYDSALEYYQKANHKARMATIYKRKGFAYEYLEDYAKVIQLEKKALKLNLEIDNKREAAIVLNYLGIAYTIIGDLDSALYYYHQGLTLSEITFDTIEIIEISQNIGISYEYRGDFDQSIEAYVESLKYCELINHTAGVFDLNLCIGKQFLKNEKLEKADFYFHNAEQLIDSVEEYYKQVDFHHTLGNYHFAQGRKQKAKRLYEKALSISAQASFKRGQAAVHKSLATLYLEEMDYENAIQNALLAVDYERLINHSGGLVTSLMVLAQTQYQQALFEKANNSLKEAVDICLEKGLYESLDEVYYHLCQSKKLEKKYGEALDYYEIYHEIKDSLWSVEVQTKIADLELKHQSEKQQQQIELLNEENNSKQQKLKARNYLIVSLVLLVFLIVGIAYFFRQIAHNKLAKMEMELQKYIISVKNDTQSTQSEPQIASHEFARQYELTQREEEVLGCICQGMNNADIGKQIFVSTNTVKYHIKNLYVKLDVKNRVEARNMLQS